MTELLTFMMGEYAAEIPVDRYYAKNHMWAQSSEAGFRFGFGAYAVRLLQDVYFLDWSLDAPTVLKQGQMMGSIESKKAESDLFAPMAGRLTQFNERLIEDPSGINVDKYGAGWLFEIENETISNAPMAGLLDPQQYLEHLGDVWEVTQRTIKGQVNG